MIEQVCSMALTYAHSDGRDAFEWGDMVEAITTIESGTAQNIEYLPAQSRATAIHEAGHVVTSHLYLDNIEHTRLSIRKRGSSLGHYQGKMREERLAGGEFRHEEVGDLVLTLGAMAAEHTFDAENSTGVGGDVNSATRAAAWMVGMCAMGPEPVDLTGRVPASEQEEAEKRIMTRFERLGLQIMNRADGNPLQADSVGSVLMDPYKREAAARLLGQAYMTALCCIRHNRDAVLQVAEVLMERKELYGDEVTELLDSVALEAPPIDVLDPSIWPKVV
jgi:cell division protease FtsH